MYQHGGELSVHPPLFPAWNPIERWAVIQSGFKMGDNRDHPPNVVQNMRLTPAWPGHAVTQTRISVLENGFVIDREHLSISAQIHMQ